MLHKARFVGNIRSSHVLKGGPRPTLGGGLLRLLLYLLLRLLLSLTCLAGSLAEEGLVLLLCLDKGILELVGIWRLVSCALAPSVKHGKRTVGVGKADGQGDGLGLSLADIGSRVPDPAAVRANVGRKLHLGDDYKVPLASPILEVWIQGFPWLTVVVRANLEGLVAAHDQAGLAVL